MSTLREQEIHVCHYTTANTQNIRSIQSNITSAIKINTKRHNSLP